MTNGMLFVLKSVQHLRKRTNAHTVWTSTIVCLQQPHTYDYVSKTVTQVHCPLNWQLHYDTLDLVG